MERAKKVFPKALNVGPLGLDADTQVTKAYFFVLGIICR